MDKISLGKRINMLRQENKLTIKELSQKVGVSTTYIQKIQGGIRHPGLIPFIKICNVLKICPSYLLQDSLDINQEVDDLYKQLNLLNPEQLEMLKAMVNTMIEKTKNIKMPLHK
jgi:transcriptional regulator with XRE-family HTH domain